MMDGMKLRAEDIHMERVPGAERKRLFVQHLRTGLVISIDVSRNGREQIARALAAMDELMAKGVWPDGEEPLRLQEAMLAQRRFRMG
jgi:hypothetical protein